MPKVNNVVQLNAFDPENVNKRLYYQVSALLTQLEEKDSRQKVTMRERIAAMVAIGRIQQIFIAMRKASGDVGSGSTVKKYATAFTDAASRRATNTRHDAKRDAKRAIAAAEPEPSDWFDQDDDTESDD